MLRRVFTLARADLQFKDIFNPAIARPEEFKVSSTYPFFVTRKGERGAARFQMVGLKIRAEEDLSKGSSINIAPECNSWARYISFFGNIYDQRHLYLMSFMSGLTFGTKRISNKQDGESSGFNLQDRNAILPTDMQSKQWFIMINLLNFMFQFPSMTGDPHSPSANCSTICLAFISKAVSLSTKELTPFQTKDSKMAIPCCVVLLLLFTWSFEQSIPIFFLRLNGSIPNVLQEKKPTSSTSPWTVMQLIIQ